MITGFFIRTGLRVLAAGCAIGVLAGFGAHLTPAKADTAPPAAFNAPQPPVIMPAPSTLQTDGSAFALPAKWQIMWQSPPTPILTRAMQRFANRMNVVAGQTVFVENARKEKDTFPLHIQYAREANFPAPTMREDYTLDVGPDGITLTAQGPAGVLHGLASIVQLVRREAAGPVMAQAHIQDSPRFAWRGLMLDVSRHFMSIPTVERQLDAMEMVKLNVLHLHLSDGAAFRVESRHYPRLQNISSHGQYYTQAEIRNLVQYAADRGIRIVPEFDTPGHSFAMLLAYPQYVSVLPMNTTDRAEINRAALDPTNPATYSFVRGLYAEMSTLFPDPVFHIGGDEVVAKQWTLTPRIAHYMQAHHFATPADLQASFTNRVAQMLKADGKTVMGWDEVLAASVPPHTIIESWRGPANTAKAAEAGLPVVVSGPYYLDRLLPASAYYETDPLDIRKDAAEAKAAAQTTGPGGTIAPPTDTKPEAPIPPLTKQQKTLILGAEGALWTEVVDEDMLDARLWPRMAAVAERFWSTPQNCVPQTLYGRLAVTQDKLELLGLKSRENADALLDRLAAGETQAPRVLLSAVSPIRNYAHNHEFLQIRHKQTATEQDLNTPSDIASPDSFEAEKFNAEAVAFVNGKVVLKPELERQLTIWADNNAAFNQVAARHAALTPALAASARLAALARAGLAALGAERTPGWREQARQTLDAARKDIAASSSIHVVTNTPQPAGDLIQRIVPGVEALVAHEGTLTLLP